jgi:hypothetical protein
MGHHSFSHQRPIKILLSPSYSSMLPTNMSDKLRLVDGLSFLADILPHLSKLREFESTDGNRQAASCSKYLCLTGVNFTLYSLELVIYKPPYYLHCSVTENDCTLNLQIALLHRRIENLPQASNNGFRYVSSLTVSAAKLRMPSDNFSVAI